MEEELKQQDQERKDFNLVINTTIHVKNEKHMDIDVTTNINENAPNFFDDDDACDPNMMLFYFWTQALAGCAGGIKSDKVNGELASRLFEIICEVEHEAIACRAIEDMQHWPSAFEGEPLDDDSPWIGDRFINIKVHYYKDTDVTNYEVESDIPNSHPDDEGPNKLLLYYWTRAIAECAMVLETQIERDYLADRLYDALMETNESLTASINDT